MPTTKPDSPTPERLPEITTDQLRKLIAQRDADPEFRFDEDTVEWFVGEKPKNDEKWSVSAKASLIDKLHGTKAYNYYDLAVRIMKIDMDRLLDEGTSEAIEALGRAHVNGEDFEFFDFASNYCNWHRPETFPRMNAVVKEILWIYRSKLGRDLTREELDTYDGFCAALREFRDRFSLQELSWRELDKGLQMFAPDVMVSPPRS